VNKLLVVVGALSLASCSMCGSREEKLKKAEDEANLAASMKARMVKGVGEALKTEGKDAAKVVAEGGGETLKALGGGVDKSLNQIKLTTIGELGTKGIGGTRATMDTVAKENKVAVYVTLEKPYTGPLELRVYDTENKEVGRSKIQVDEKESTAKYMDFKFDEHTPLRTADHVELR
jgi:hypothetical protein